MYLYTHTAFTVYYVFKKCLGLFSDYLYKLTFGIYLKKKTNFSPKADFNN